MEAPMMLNEILLELSMLLLVLDGSVHLQESANSIRIMLRLNWVSICDVLIVQCHLARLQ